MTDGGRPGGQPGPRVSGRRRPDGGRLTPPGRHGCRAPARCRAR